MRGEPAIETDEVLVAFGQHQGRSAVTHGLNDLVADHLIAGLVFYQELVERLELNPLVRAPAAG
jgi:hypothetical protein